MARLFEIFRLSVFLIGAKRWVQFVACLALGATLSVLMGQDANWDLRNYHLYTAYAFLSGRLDRDWFAADIQTLLPPTLDIPYVLLAMGPLLHYPRLLAAVMGLWFGLLLFVTLRLTVLLFAPFPKMVRQPLTLISTAVSVTGAAVFSQLGSTTGDIPVGAMIIGGFGFVLKALSMPRETGRNNMLVGGFIFGCAAGCKLTAAVYSPPLCLSLFAAFPPRPWVKNCGLFSVAWIAGYVFSFGWWGWRVWEKFSNPYFPYLNNIFRSPLGPPLSLMDSRFFPHDAMHWLFFPFYWAWKSEPMTALESVFADPRMAIAYLALGALLIGYVLRRFKSTEERKPKLTPSQRVAILFLVFSYIGWIVTSSIIRYAVPIEVLAIPVAMTAVYALTEKRVAAALAVGICVVSYMGTSYFEWSRVEYGDKVFDVDMSWTPKNTLFVSVIGPVAYLAAFVPQEINARFVGFGYITIGRVNWPLGDIARDMIRLNPGPVKVLFTDEMRSGLTRLPIIGISADMGSCRIINSNIDLSLEKPVYVCDTQSVSEGDAP